MNASIRLSRLLSELPTPAPREGFFEELESRLRAEQWVAPRTYPSLRLAAGAAAVAVVAVGASAYTAGVLGRATAGDEKPAHHAVQTSDAFKDVLDEGRPSMEMSAALAYVGPSVRVPRSSLTGNPIQVLAFEDEQGKRELAIEYSSGLRFFAAHRNPGDLRAKYDASYVDYETGERRYVFRGNSRIESMTVLGRFAMLSKPGPQTNPDGSTLRWLGTSLTVQDEDVIYTLSCRDSRLTRARLVKIAEAMLIAGTPSAP